MKVLTGHDLMQEYSRLSGKPCMWINCEPNWRLPDADIHEMLKAAPYLDVDEHAQILMDGHGCIVFDTVEEMQAAFERTVGDDGPTKANPYNGPARVYALTCVNGELENENT